MMVELKFNIPGPGTATAIAIWIAVYSGAFGPNLTELIRVSLIVTAIVCAIATWRIEKIHTDAEIEKDRINKDKEIEKERISKAANIK